MTSPAFKQKLTMVRDFTLAALFAGGAIAHYNATTPADTRPAEARNAFVDAAPIRLDWATAFFKPAQDTTATQAPAVQKTSFTDEKPIRLGR